jgi:small subunit ribosomal protein S11
MPRSSLRNFLRPSSINAPANLNWAYNTSNMASNTALRTFRSLTSTICASCRHTRSLRPFSQTTRTRNASPTDRNKPEQSLDELMGKVAGNFKQAGGDQFSNMIPDGTAFKNLAQKDWEEDDKHKLHIYATKHNTHLCLTKPNRDPMISVSCGNIGFRKAGRGTYDAAYQLAAFLMSRVLDKGLLPQIQKLELVYRGFGPGREAVTKAILGAEGKRIRPLIVKLADSTRLKFGGVRSKKPRRLG